MNVCIVCQADGVLNALNHWYCVDHLEQGLADVKEFVDRVRGAPDLPWTTLEET